MAPLALAAILPALGIGGTAAAATGAALGTAAAGASAFSALSGIGSAIGMIGTIAGGFSKANESNEEASEADLQSGQDQIASEQRQTQMKQKLLDVLGQNDVTFAAGGTDTTQGIAANSRAAITADADNQISLENDDDDFQRKLLAARSANLRSAASGDVGGALLSALGQGISAAAGAYKTGA